MKIQNQTVSNLSVGAKSSQGTAMKKWLVIPGEATIELDDKEYLEEYAEPCARMLEAGNLKITKAPRKTAEQTAKEEEAALEAARKLVAEADKPKVAPKTTTKK